MPHLAVLRSATADSAAVALSVETHVHGSVTQFDVSLTCRKPFRGGRVVLPLERTAKVMIEQGFQSWSMMRRCTPDDVRPTRAEAPRWFRGQMLTDRDGAGRSLTGDGYLVFDGGVAGFLTAEKVFGLIRVDPDGSLSAEWLLDDLAFTPGDVLELDPLVLVEGEVGAAYSVYAELAGEASGALPARPTPKVWCSWYHYFSEVTPGDVRTNLRFAAEHDLDVVQIDDGWQAEIGIWNAVNPKWGTPLRDLAAEIRAKGLTAGVWTAPFLALEGGTIARTRPEWLVRNERGEPTTALFHGVWGGKVFALDTTNEDVLAHLVSTFRQLRSDGFDYFKIDFLHAASTPGLRQRGDSNSRAQTLRKGLRAVREGIGPDAFLVGCGSPLLSAVGFVDAMRVSEDVAPFYEPRTYFEGFMENTVAAKNAIEASVLRAPLHQRWFTLDPDCVLLRSVNTELTSDERALVSTAALAASGFIALSDDLSTYGGAEWDRAAALFAEAAKHEGPRDIEDPFAETLTITSPSGQFRVAW